MSEMMCYSKSDEISLASW